MCGIFGTTKLERYKTLYELNKDRGSFSYGACYLSAEDDICIHKCGGVIEPPDMLASNDYLLGHTQAPTSRIREFTCETSHPFSAGDWVIAHNGVLSNDREIIAKFDLHETSDVDSSVIPALIDYYEIIGPDRDHEIEAIVDGLSELEGTFAVWMVNRKSKNVYFARNGSTLFIHKNKKEFSSKMTKGFKSIPEGVIFKYDKTNEQFEANALFEYDSPFLIL